MKPRRNIEDMTRARGGGETPSLLDLAYDAIFAFALTGDVITYWNRGAEELYGWRAEEALGRTPEQVLRSRLKEPREKVIDTVLRDGRWEGEIVQTARGGQELQVEARWSLQRDAAGNPVGILEINRDATERRQLAQRFQLLVDSVEDYAIYMLDPDGTVRSWNLGAERINGWTAAEIVGRHFSLFFTPEDRESGAPERELETARRDGRFEEEGWRVRKDGSRFWSSVAVTAIHDSSGELTGFAKVTRDVTQKRLETDRLKSLDRAKSDFLNLAAHELRGPITVIAGYLSMIEEGVLGEVSPRVKEAIGPLRAKTEEMGVMVEQMVEAARIEDGSMQLRTVPVDLSEVAAEAVRTGSLLLTPAHRLQLELDGAVVVRADRSRVRTIISNLLSNAVKYSPEGGLIVCRVASAGATGTVEVSDEGLGIEEAALPGLFTRFGRVVTEQTRHIPGTGLGLYLSRELARLQGGDLTVVSRAGEGSTFTLSLPVDRSAKVDL